MVKPRYSVPNGRFNPKHLACMPTLTQTSNFAYWATNLEITLNAADPKWHRLLTGAWAKPAVTSGRLTRAEMNALNEWLSVSTHILTLINRSVESTIKAEVADISDAREAYFFLRKTYGSPIRDSGFELYKKWMAIVYTSGSPAKFVTKWQLAFQELNESSPRYKVPWLHVAYQFLAAVEATPETRIWTKGTCLDKNCSSFLDIEVLIQEFLEFENLRLGNDSDED